MPFRGGRIMSHRQEMAKQDPAVRKRNFQEVALGFTGASHSRGQTLFAMQEPLCREGCPVEIDIPDFIAQVAADDLVRLYEPYRRRIVCLLSAGGSALKRISEFKCVLGKKGSGLHRSFRKVCRGLGPGEWGGITAASRQNQVKVAVIGSGPAGLLPPTWPFSAMR